MLRTMMSLKIKLLNFFTYIRATVTDDVCFHNTDGRLVSMDDWEGYDNCMRPGCGHYRCEHSFGEVWTTSYVSSEHHEAAGLEVGDNVSWPRGCMNGGCHCPGFWTESDLIGWVQQLNHARINGSWDLEKVPGVKHVDSGIQTVVRIDTYLDKDDPEGREAVYIVEETLHHEHPDVLFDFRVRWDEPPQN